MLAKAQVKTLLNMSQIEISKNTKMHRFCISWCSGRLRGRLKYKMAVDCAVDCTPAHINPRV